jgi:hypothetical protein
MKYITLIVSPKEGNQVVLPLIFPAYFNHNDMAKIFARQTFKIFNTMPHVRSAGFINAIGECSGRSETLNIESMEDDSSIINTYDYMCGIV